MPKSNIFNAVSVSVLSGIGIVIQLINQLIIAYYFGANADIEAYYIGITVPIYIVTVLNFCINTAFIPKYIEIKSCDHEEAKQFAQSALFVVFYSSIVIFALGIFFREQIITTIFPTLTPYVSKKAIELSIYLWSAVVLVPLFIVLSSKMQSDSSFLVPAVVPLLNILSMTVILVLFSKRYGIETYAIATVVGNVVQLFILVLYNLKWVSLKVGRISKNLSNWLNTMVILASGNVITRLTPVMERTASSTQPLGAIAELSYANRIITMVSSIVTAGIATTGFTQLSESSAANDTNRLQLQLVKIIRITLLLTLPIIVILFYQIENLIRIFFMRGKFNESNVHNISILIKCYLVFLLSANIGTIIGRGLYAIKMTKIATTLDAFGVIFYVVILIYFTRMFGIEGVAWAFSIYYLCGVVVSSVILFRTIKYKFNIEDYKFLGQLIISSLVMMIPLRVIDCSSILSVSAIVILSVIVFLATLSLLKNSEMIYFTNQFFPGLYEK